MEPNTGNRFKLQVNNSGAWKDILTATDETIDTVKTAVTDLVKAADQRRLTFRLVRAESTTCSRVLAYCQAPDAEWIVS